MVKKCVYILYMYVYTYMYIYIYIYEANVILSYREIFVYVSHFAF